MTDEPFYDPGRKRPSLPEPQLGEVAVRVRESDRARPMRAA